MLQFLQMKNPVRHHSLTSNYFLMLTLNYKFLIKIGMCWLVKLFTDSPWCFLLISSFSYWEKMVDPVVFLLSGLWEGNISLTVSIYHSASFQLQVRATWSLIWKTIYVHTEKLLPFSYFMLLQASFSAASISYFFNPSQNRGS